MLNKVKTVSYTLPWDDAPLDISFVFENEKPTGIHGFVTQKEDKFVFEDGTTARFWGTNFNSAANTDTVYNNEGTVQFSKGHGPVQAEVIAADIEFESSQTGFHVEASTSHGMHVGRTEVTEKEGKVAFRIGGTFASIYYLIQKM